jgi:flagellar P-ring protein precursor FlgI
MAPFSRTGQTAVTEKADITITSRRRAGADGTRHQARRRRQALNTPGATPQDLLAILQAMKTAGALMAEIEVTR